VAIDGTVATRVTLDGGSLATTTSKRFLSVAEGAPSATDNRAGSSIWVSLLSLNFQNARVESAGRLRTLVEKIRMFDVSFTNCVATNSASVTNAAGGALFVRAPDNVGLTFRPDVRLTRVSFKGNKTLAGGSVTNPEGGGFFLGANNGCVGHVLLTDVTVGGRNAADQNLADGDYGGASIFRAESVSIARSNFQSDVPQNGEVGGLRAYSTNGGAVSIGYPTFIDNRAKTGSGGLSVTNNVLSSVLLRDVTLMGNAARYSGGAYISNNGSVIVSNFTISSNVATSYAGGLVMTGSIGAVTLDDITISANRVNDGSESTRLPRCLSRRFHPRPIHSR